MLLDSGAGENTTAKAYRLLKAILKTAVDDGLIRSNPCRIDGAGREHAPERPVLTIPEVFALADAFTDRRYRLLVLLAVFCSLRWGELAALTRDAVDQEHGIVSVRVGVVELAGGQLVTGPPKSAAGKRDVSIPAFLLPDVAAHLEDFTTASPRALVFPSRGACSFGGATSAGPGARRWRRRACRVFTSMTCGIRAIRWPVKRALASVS
jgi:integrase